MSFPRPRLADPGVDELDERRRPRAPLGVPDLGAPAAGARRGGRAPRAGARASSRTVASGRWPRSSGCRSRPEARRYDRSMAVTAQPKLDAERLRADFPIFEHPIHGKPLAYLDSAASSQKPRQVLDAMTTFYETSYANIHRGVYDLAERSTEAYEAARETVRGFVNAESAREIVFTRNVTAALNAVAYGWGLDNLGPGDLVVATELEHHSNFVPWQYIAGRTGAEFAVVPVDRRRGAAARRRSTGSPPAGGRRWSRARRSPTRSARSRPVPRLVEWAHEQGAIAVVDAAQAAPHTAARRPGDRRRLRRLHRAQGLRADRDRRPLGPRGAAGGDVAVRARRPHDPQGHRREDDLERDPAQVRGGHGADRRGGRARGRARLRDRGRARRRSSGTSAS